MGQQPIYQIHVLPGTSFPCREQETLLEEASRHRMKISVGCKGGACGICKIKIMDGQVDHGVYSKKALTEQEIHEGYTLSCQAKPKSQLVIHLQKSSFARENSKRSNE